MFDIERNDENGTASHYDMDITTGNNQLEKFSVGGSNTMTQDYDEMGQMTSKMPYSWPVNTNPDEQIDTINWTADGKINYIVYSKLLEIFNDLTEEVDEEMVMFKKYYYYDGMGNRVAVITDANFHQCNNIGKTIFDHCESGISPSIPPVLYYDCEECLEKNNYKNEYYTYEAGGKLLTKYDKLVYWSDACGGSVQNYCSNTITDYQTTNLEWYVYGSASDGRIATVYPRFDIKDDDSFDDNFENDPPSAEVAYNTEMISNTFTANAGIANITGIETHRHLGEKRYEIKDHLGNVRATVSDIKNAENYSASASSWKFLADVKSMSNYFPYGMKIDAGSWSPSKYHFAYNGKQEESFDKDFLHYGARSHDTENGQFISPDPKEKMYGFQSTYVYSENNPISKIDIEGKYAVSVHNEITYKIFLELGTSIEKSYKIAHFSSVYADHPDEELLAFDNLVSGSNNTYETFRYNYKATEESQSSKNVKWHAMMTDEEFANGMTREFAMQRGLRFGWDNIFSQKNKIDFGKLGQGLHALQDAYAHKGIHEKAHVGKSPTTPYYLLHDYLGDTSQAELITKTAGIILNLFEGDASNIKNGTKLDFNGMSKKQLKQTQDLFKAAGFELEKVNDNGIYRAKKVDSNEKK